MQSVYPGAGLQAEQRGQSRETAHVLHRWHITKTSRNRKYTRHAASDFWSVQGAAGHEIDCRSHFDCQPAACPIRPYARIHELRGHEAEQLNLLYQHMMDTACMTGNWVGADTLT